MQRGFIFDLDGTIYIDNQLIPGALDTVQKLIERGDKIIYFTNKSIESIATYVQKLRALGIEVQDNQIVNSNYLVARYLEKNIAQQANVMVIGENPLIEEIEKIGIGCTWNPVETSYVIIGWDREFTYEKLNLAFQAWKKGATIIATNPDRTCPVASGEIPDCGAMIGALEGATGEKVEMILGKPSVQAAKFITQELMRLPPEQCFMIGDRIETDIKMGIESGMHTVLVLTGITTKEMVNQSQYQPEFIVDSIRDLIDATTNLNSKGKDLRKK
ncbi:HAD-IIA family hydrolase [Oceanobacillus sp. 1P07AA]|uniref:HAD-IIA family hydrolase n=1 Tax=Oceanobacillus sp. 1P07AA TaxID=3132293 RepID=UPI0039A68A5F